MYTVEQLTNRRPFVAGHDNAPRRDEAETLAEAFEIAEIRCRYGAIACKVLVLDEAGKNVRMYWKSHDARVAWVDYGDNLT